MTSTEHESDDRKESLKTRTWAFLILILTVAVVPYLATLSFGFVYDDRLAIEQNAHLRVWPGFERIFLSDIWSLSGLANQSNYYRPMFLLAYEAIFHAVGATPWAFHLVNVLFHAAATAMVFLLALHFCSQPKTAAIAAVLFALHPAHVEPVAWIAALSELAYTFFVLSAVYFYTQERLSRWLPVAALACFAISLLWKESAVAFAAIAILYDILVLNRWRWLRWISITGVTLLYLGVRAVAIGGLAPSVFHPGLSPLTQVLTAISNVGFYAWKLIAPVRLSAFYEPEFVTGITLKVGGALVLLLLCLWKLRGKYAWAACWIVVSLFPVLLVSRIAMPLADRDLYLASAGFVWLAAAFIERLGRTASVALLTTLVIAYGALTLERLPAWRDDLALFEAELRDNPQRDGVRLLLASEHGRRGHVDKALTEVNTILDRDPRQIEALLNKAGLLASAKDWPGLRATCAKVFERNPNSARCLFNMGYLDEEEGRLREARDKFAQAFRVDPGLSQALLQRGIVEAKMGDLTSAAQTLEIAVQRNPTAPALNNLGSVYANRGEMGKAVAAFQAAVRVDPAFESAQRNLAIALADSK